MLPQELIAAKSQELHQIADALVTLAIESTKHQTPIHEVESKTFEALLRAGREVLELLIQLQGDGNVGEKYELPEGRTLRRSEEPHSRPYVSIFGELEITRYVYAEREGQKVEFAAVDARLALPESKFSYVLQDWNQNFAMEQPFAKVSQTLKRILGLDQHVDSLERMNRQMAQHVEDFHGVQKPPRPTEEGQILVQSADGKGVPIRHLADAPSIRDHQHQRGPKPDRKKMATVGAVYSIDRHYRTPEEVVESLFRDPQDEHSKQKGPRPRPQHKRMRAELNHFDQEGNWLEGRPIVFGWISDEVAARRAGTYQPLVCIMDGEESLWGMRDVFQGEVPMVDILDLLHVTPRLWKAASQFHAQGSRSAEKFVRKRVLRILRGEVRAVIRGLRRMATEKLSGTKRGVVMRICKFFAKNKHRMEYDRYLACGYPIASGVIEGTCRNVVKDRLERTGMNWVIQGAAAMLQLRCIHLCDEWDKFVAFRVKRETKRLYPYRDTLQPPAYSMAA